MAPPEASASFVAQRKESYFFAATCSSATSCVVSAGVEVVTIIFTPEFLDSEEPSCSLSTCPKSGVEVITRSCLALPAVIMSLAGNIVNAAIRAGIRKVKIRNAFVRTRSRYSRRAIRKTLRIVLSYHLDENLFQRRLHDLESVDA